MVIVYAWEILGRFTLDFHRLVYHLRRTFLLRVFADLRCDLLRTREWRRNLVWRAPRWCFSGRMNATMNGERGRVNGQRTTVNSQRSTVNGQQSMDNRLWTTIKVEGWEGTRSEVLRNQRFVLKVLKWTEDGERGTFNGERLKLND